MLEISFTGWLAGLGKLSGTAWNTRDFSVTSGFRLLMIRYHRIEKIPTTVKRIISEKKFFLDEIDSTPFRIFICSEKEN